MEVHALSHIHSVFEKMGRKTNAFVYIDLGTGHMGYKMWTIKFQTIPACITVSAVSYFRK